MDKEKRLIDVNIGKDCPLYKNGKCWDSHFRFKDMEYCTVGSVDVKYICPLKERDFLIRLGK